MFLASACTRRPTQLLVVVDSDLPESERACIAARVSSWGTEEGLGPMDQSFFYFDGRTPTGPRLPFSFAVLPPRNRVSRVQLEVVALRAADCDPATPNFANARVRRIVRTGFAEEQTLRLPIFLAASCIPAACMSTQDCEGGRCQVVPELMNLATVVPGQEFQDAGMPADTSPDSRLVEIPYSPTRTGAAFSTTFENTGLDAEHNAIYPVGAFGRDGIFVAAHSVIAQGGALGSPNPRSSGGDDGVLSLWRITAPTTVSTPTQWRAGGYPYPIVTRAIDVSSGETILCGTMGSPGMQRYEPPGTTIGCSAQRCAFVSRIDATGAQTEFHTIDNTALGEVWCTDIDVIGGRVMLALHVSASAAPGQLRVNGTEVPVSHFDPALQNLVTVDIGTPAALSVSTSSPIVVVGHDAPIAPSRTDVGAVLLHRAVLTGGHVMASSSDVLAPNGADATGGPAQIHFAHFNDLAPTPDWDHRIVVVGGTLILRALVTSPRTTWSVFSVTNVDAATELYYGTEMALGPVVHPTVNRTYVARIETNTLGAISMPIGIEFTADETAGNADILGSQLLGHGLATSTEGIAFYATNVADGESLGDDALFSVTGEVDPLLVFVSPTPIIRRAWQWDGLLEGSTESPVDWRHTHVVWSPGGWLAIGGYVENQGSGRWQRRLSYFHIYPAR